MRPLGVTMPDFHSNAQNFLLMQLHAAGGVLTYNVSELSIATRMLFQEMEERGLLDSSMTDKGLSLTVRLKAQQDSQQDSSNAPGLILGLTPGSTREALLRALRVNDGQMRFTVGQTPLELLLALHTLEAEGVLEYIPGPDPFTFTYRLIAP